MKPFGGFRLSIVLGTLLLGACGKIGPYEVKLKAHQSFEIPTGQDRSLALAADQQIRGLATYFPGSKKLELELGSEKITFKKTQLDEDRGELSSKPETSGVRTTSGEWLGLSSKRSLKCNPDCQRVEREIRTESCTYYVNQPETQCYWEDGRYVCRTVFVHRPMPGTQVVERVVRTRDYDVTGSIYGATLGVMASTKSQFSEIEVDVISRSACR